MPIAMPMDNVSPLSVQALDDPQEQAGFTRWQTNARGDREAVSQLRISGMYCAACAGVIESALHAIPGVLEARVSASSERAQVRWDPQRTQLSSLVLGVRQAGYGALPDVACAAQAQRQRELRLALWRLFVACFCMMQVMMYATPAYLAEPGDIGADSLRLLQWASWLLSLPVLLFSAGPFFKGAWNSLVQRRIGMDVPVALGIAVTFVASTGATFDPTGVFGHEVYFDSLTMFVFFLLGGRWLELRARHKVADVLEGALARLPDSVERLLDDGRSESVALSRLRPGDRVRVMAGQAYPADGVLLEGRTLADEALLTGESRPVRKSAGDVLAAGSLNLDAPVLMRVDRLGADTRYAGIVSLIQDAMTQRPAMMRQADRWAGPFLWMVLFLSAVAAVAWSFIDPSRAVSAAVAVLIVTCPCALSLAAPSALLSATGALARRGILLQRAASLEALAAVDRVLLDKTGTLTEDRLAWTATHVHLAGGDAHALLAQAASLARHSAHPASRALVEAGGERGTELGWIDVEEHAGQGLQALGPDGRVYRLGRAAWVGSTSALPVGDTHVAFGRDGLVLATFDLAESMRADAPETVARLRAAGLSLGLLSGDTAERTQALADRLGIQDVQSAATPQDKLDAVAAAQAQGRVVAMVGDGLNDAPVMARADVSFAFAHGSAVSQSAADAVLLGSRLADVADAREHAIRTLRVMRQNLTWAAIYNLTCIPLAMIGWLPPWAAGLGMATSSLIVVLNALRLNRMPVRT
jgi:P-type Cu2+ transporter